MLVSTTKWFRRINSINCRSSLEEQQYLWGFNKLNYTILARGSAGSHRPINITNITFKDEVARGSETC